MLDDISRHIIAERRENMAAQTPMTEANYYILLALMKPGHGYGMMQRIKELSGGRIEMGPGTLYGVLTRMNKEGLIVLTEEDGRRKNYAITDEGKKALHAEYERLKLLVHDGAILEEDEACTFDTVFTRRNLPSGKRKNTTPIWRRTAGSWYSAE